MEVLKPILFIIAIPIIIALCYLAYWWIREIILLKWTLPRLGREEEKKKCKQKDCDGRLDTGKELGVQIGPHMGQIAPSYACKKCGRMYHINGDLLFHLSGKIPFLDEDGETIHLKESLEVK